jgi:rhodanese-related sulfurtransferase
MKTSLLQRLATITFLSFLTAACGSSEPRAISANTAAEMLLQQVAVIVDVREQNEWNEAHIQGAIHIPLGQLKARASELNAYKNSPLIVQCRSGRRSKEGYQILESGGFTNLYNLDGGINAWTASGMVTQKIRVAM